MKKIYLKLSLLLNVLVGYSQPTNIDFSAGNINGWTFEEGTNTNSILMTTNGYSTSTQYSLLAVGAVEPNSIPITMISPLGGNYIRIGQYAVGTGGVAYKLKQTYRVTSTSSSLVISYAVVLSNLSHTCSDQPYFDFKINDSLGNVIANSQTHYTIPGVSCSSGDPSFVTSGTFKYRDWVNSTFSLINYISTNVTIELIASGCVQDGHSGYAYIDAEIIGASVGLKEPIVSEGILISPNPTSEILNVSFSGAPQNTKIELYNSIGALVLSETMNNKINTINVSDLSNGMYFMKVLENNKVISVKKLIKQ